MSDEKTREVYLVEIMETPELDREIRVYGHAADADAAVKSYRAKGRKARTWTESVLWS